MLASGWEIVFWLAMNSSTLASVIANHALYAFDLIYIHRDIQYNN